MLNHLIWPALFKFFSLPENGIWLVRGTHMPHGHEGGFGMFFGIGAGMRELAICWDLSLKIARALCLYEYWLRKLSVSDIGGSVIWFGDILRSTLCSQPSVQPHKSSCIQQRTATQFYTSSKPWWCWCLCCKLIMRFDYLRLAQYRYFSCFLLSLPRLAQYLQNAALSFLPTFWISEISRSLLV